MAAARKTATAMPPPLKPPGAPPAVPQPVAPIAPVIDVVETAEVPVRPSVPVNPAIRPAEKALEVSPLVPIPGQTVNAEGFIVGEEVDQETLRIHLHKQEQERIRSRH